LVLVPQTLILRAGFTFYYQSHIKRVNFNHTVHKT